MPPQQNNPGLRMRKQRHRAVAHGGWSVAKSGERPRRLCKQQFAEGQVSEGAVEGKAADLDLVSSPAKSAAVTFTLKEQREKRRA